MSNTNWMRLSPDYLSTYPLLKGAIISIMYSPLMRQFRAGSDSMIAMSSFSSEDSPVSLLLICENSFINSSIMGDGLITIFLWTCFFSILFIYYWALILFVLFIAYPKSRKYQISNNLKIGHLIQLLSITSLQTSLKYHKYQFARINAILFILNMKRIKSNMDF